jgi:hypothetical protein
VETDNGDHAEYFDEIIVICKSWQVDTSDDVTYASHPSSAKPTLTP